MVDHGKRDCRIQTCDRIIQYIIEKIDTSNMMEVDNLEVTERAEGGSGSTDISPKRITLVLDYKLIICFLQANHKDNEYFDAEDMGRHPRLLKEHTLMSSVIILQVEETNFDAGLITKVLAASENEQEWQEKRTEFERLENEGKELTKNWQSNNELLNYKNRL